MTQVRSLRPHPEEAMQTPFDFVSILEQLRAAYEAEIARLVELYRPRILAGEFSGLEDVDPLGRRGQGIGGPRFQRLGRELLRDHPWLANERSCAIVAACSTWFWRCRAEGARQEISGCNDESADDCLVHDVLAAAARLGWIQSYGEDLNEEHPYRVRPGPKLRLVRVGAGRRAPNGIARAS
jgi:hypothetical protein